MQRARTQGVQWASNWGVQRASYYNHWVRGRVKHIPLPGSSPFAFPAKGKQLASAKRRQLGNAKGEQLGSAKRRQVVEKQEILSPKRS